MTFRDIPDEEVARWSHALTTFLKKVTLKFDRPLVLKSPPHTARIRLLLGLFPDARFVHIHREPYEVFRSTRHLIRSVQPVFRLQECPPPDHDDAILGVYTEMYDAYFEQRGLIPEGRLRDVGYEELERDPVMVIGSIYEALGLAGFEDMRPAWRATSLPSLAIARTGSTSFPSPYVGVLPTSGAGASTNGDTTVEIRAWVS